MLQTLRRIGSAHTPVFLPKVPTMFSLPTYLLVVRSIAYEVIHYS